MGGASSKVARRLPSKPGPSLTGARTENIVPGPNTVRGAMASEVKNHEIDMDARDPDFMQKLNRLGPVKVDHGMATVRVGEHMQHILRSRDVSEQQATSHVATKNRMTAGMLFDLLEQRKNISSRDELLDLAKRYDMEVDVLERVATFVNTPSTVADSLRKILEDDGRERITTLARWDDNNLKDRSPLVQGEL